MRLRSSLTRPPQTPFTKREAALPPFAHMYDPLFSTPELTTVLSDRMFCQRMLQFETALARSLELCHLTPAGTAAILSTVTPETIDFEEVATAAGNAGNVCIPFVKALTAAVAAINTGAAAYVHWGATSQDVIDTALLLQLREAWKIIRRDLDLTCSALSERIPECRHMLMAGRTWLQQGPPVTLGLKMATWLDALQRQRERMTQAESRIFALQFGGAVGTLAALHDKGRDVSNVLAKQLGLTAPALPWHTQRDRIAELATLFGMLSGTLGKIARDVSLLMQTEVGEFLEPAGQGKGTSSTMPHKRNPVGSAVMLGAVTRVPALTSTMLSAMVQEHERGLGAWHAEWETIIEITRLTGGALARALDIVRGGTVEQGAIKQNLDLLRGVTMSEAAAFYLATQVGKGEAHRIVERVSKKALASRTSFLTELQQDPDVVRICDPEKLAHALDPSNYLGSADEFINAVLDQEHGWRSNASA